MSMTKWKAAAFLFAAFTLIVSPASPQDQRLTARQVIAHIQAHVGVPWQEDTVDTFKAGNPDAPVSGIAVTMMATLDVLQQAAASGKNLIITHEPTFYNHFDKLGSSDRDKSGHLYAEEKDPVLAAKQAFIEKHGLIIWRFHDHWHARKPDGIETGMIRALGWEKFQNPNDPRLFVIPETTVGELAAAIGKRLGTQTIRLVGDPSMKLTKLAFIPGYAALPDASKVLENGDVEVLVTGETREWETVEYVADAVTEGKRKALIILGHISSEQAGMEECARWLKTFVTEVPIEFIPTANPFSAEPFSPEPSALHP